MATPNEVALSAFHRSIALAKQGARKYLRKFPAVPPDEIHAAAMYGLWQTALSHGQLEPRQFRWLARVRIKGAIIDAIRTADWLPRYARKSYGKEMHRVFIDSLDALSESRLEGEMSTPEPDYAADIDKKADLAILHRAVASLPERDRLIVQQLLQGKNQAELASRFGLSQARMSQILTRVTATLRGRV